MSEPIPAAAADTDPTRPDAGPVDQADAQPTEPAEPQDKSDLVAQAIDRGIPSYEAWAMSDDDLKTRLEN